MANKKLLYGTAGLLIGGLGYFFGMKNRRHLPQSTSENPTDREFEFACEILNLPKTGSFTQDDLRVHHRELLIAFHPDKFVEQKEKSYAEKMCLWAGWSRQVVENSKGWDT